MAILKRINKFQGLKDIDVLEEESGLSSRFFQVFDFPTTLPQGKSSFLIAGSPFLKNNVELKIEILDAGGNTVYTEPVPNYLEGQARRVSIEIYDDVVPGDGIMYLVGELKTNYKSFGEQLENQDEVTGNIFDPATFGAFGAGNVPPEFVEQVQAFNAVDVPEEFQGVYNVRYSRPIFINPTIPNEEPIFFYKQPTVSVSEIVKPFILPLGDVTPVTLSGSVSVNPAPDLPPPPVDIVPVDEGYPAISAKDIELLGQQIEKFKNSKKAKINPFQNQSFRSRGRLVRRASPEVDRFTIEVGDMQEGVENDSGVVSSAFVGSSLTIKNPKVDETKFPTDKFTIPTSYTTSIKKVKNNATMVPEDDFLVTDIATGEQVPAAILTGGTDSSNMEVTMSYTPQPTASLSDTHFRSFAKVTTANLRTFSGDVFKAKVYAKSEGSLGDFEPMWEGPIESPQLLVDPFSETGFVNIGYFHNKSVHENHWISGSNTTITRDDSQLIDGIEISGSNFDVDKSLEFTTSGSFALEPNVPYTLQFNSYFYKELAQVTAQDTETTFECEVQVSTLASTTNGDVDNYITLGKVNVDDFQGVTEGEIPSVFSTFISSQTGNPRTKVRFKVNSGRVIISDVVLRPYSETNFNPDYFECIIPLPYPLPKRPDNYDFLVEFYDVNNNLAETFSIKEKVPFSGPAPVIADGLDATFSGSMLIGESMEMFGVNPAYLRSVGYRGFQHSIDNNLGGFMIYSGSINARISASEVSGFEYNGGVGFEVVDAGGSTDRFMRFRTQPSIFEVQTDTFFLGSDAQFVSGSGGNIEISSSNFHLTPEGDVTMSGTITAEAGNLGDFQIIDGQISGSNITMNATNSSIFKTDQGPGSDTAAAFPNLRNEYYIDFTPTEEDPDNFFIKMGPNFMVNKDGILIASGAEFIGTITASAGLIGGFTTDSHSFSSNDIFISGSPAVGGVDDPLYMFISTSNFNVKQDGSVTGSQFLLEGGTISEDVSILGTVAANSILTPATINGSPATEANASSSISSKGFAAFRSASIGGWVIDPTSITDPNEQVKISSNTGVIALGTTIPTNLNSNGIFLTGSGEFNLRVDANNFIKNGENGFEITTQDLNIDTTTLDLSTDNGGTIKLGTSPSMTAAGIFLSGSGEFNLQTDADNFLRKSGATFSIKSSTFDLATPTISMSSAGDGKIAMGSTPNINVNGTNQGIYMDGTGDFLARGDANNFFKMDGTSISMASQTFDLDAGSLIMDSSGDSGNGVIRLGGSGGPNSPTDNTTGIYLDGGGAFNVVGDTKNLLRVDGGNFTIKSEAFELLTPHLSMSSATNDGIIALGAVPPVAHNSGDGIFFDGTGKMLIGSGSGDRLQFDGTNFTVQVGSLELDANNIEISSTKASMSLGEGNIILDGTNAAIHVGVSGSTKSIELRGSSTQGYIATGKTSATSATAGFWLANNNTDPEFHVGNASNFLKFDGGEFEIASENLEVSASTIQVSTAEASMSLGHNNANPYGRIILSGTGTPKLAIGASAQDLSLTSGAGVFIDGAGNFRFGDDDGHVKFDGGSFSITGTDVDINVTELNVTSSGFELSSTEASMSLGTNKQWLASGKNTNPFLSIGQSTAGFENTGIFLGYVSSVSRPRVSFVGSVGHFKFDTDVDIATQKLSVDANNIEISSQEASMSLGEGNIILDGELSKITLGTANPVILQGGNTDNFLALGGKSSFSNEGSGTNGIIIGMDSTNPQAEFVAGPTDYFIFDGGVDIKTTSFELSANSGNLQVSSGDRAIRLSSGSAGQVTIQGDGTDGFIAMGNKSSFANEGSGTSGIIIGMDANNPQAEFVKSATDYLIFDDGLDIKTPNFKLDTDRLDIDSSTARISVFDLQDDEVVRIGELTGTNTFGIKIFDGTGTGTSNELVKLGGDGNEIAGWTITNDALTGGSMIIRQDGTIESAGFASNVAGSGFRLTAANGGFLEVENAKIRGTMSTTVFEKESVNAVGGQLYVANSTTIKSGSIVLATDTTMSVDNASGFSTNEVLSVKKVDTTGFSTEYMLVESASLNNPSSLTDFSGKLFVQRGYSGSVPTGQDSGSLGDTASTATFYSGSQVIVSTGKIGTGYIRLNANPNDPTTPYIDIVERSGSAIYDVELKARLGDLSGLSSGLLFGETNPGFGLFTENVFLQGAITATTGSITGILHVDTSDTQKVSIGKDVSGTEDGIHINDVNYWYTTGNFKVGDSAGNFVSSSGEISTDKLEVDAGSGDLQISSGNTSMSFADGDILLKKDGSNAKIFVGGNASKQIEIFGSHAKGYIRTGKDSVDSLTEGFWLANNNANAEFHVGDSTSALKFASNQLHITSSKFELDAGDGDVQISSLHSSMSLGQRTIEMVGDQANQKGLIRVGSDDAKNLQLTGSATTGVIKSGKYSFTDNSNAGIWIANNNAVTEFNIGNATEFIKFDSTSGNLQIASSDIEVTASNVDISTGVILVDADDFQINSTIPSMSLGYDSNTNAGLTFVGGSPTQILFGPSGSEQMRLEKNTTDSFLQIGSATFDSGTSAAGIIIGSDGGTAELHLVTDGDKYFKYDGDELDIRTTKFRVNTGGGFDISGTSGTGTSNFLKLGSATSATAGKGAYIDGGGNFRVGTATSGTSFIRFNPTSEELQIKTSNLNIDTTTMDIVGSGSETRISMGTSPPTNFSSNGVIISGSGLFNFQEDIANYIRRDSTGLDIKSQTFGLDAGTIIVSSSLNSGAIKLGSSAKDITETANTGIYMDGGGNFRVGTATNGAAYLHFDQDTSALDIKTGVFKLDTSNLDIDSAAGGSGSIALGATPPTQYNNGTGFFVDGSGRFLLGNASTGQPSIKWNGSTLEVTGTININNFDSDFGSLISGSSNELSGSVGSEIGALQEGSSSMQTQVVLSSGGMALKNAAGTTTLANYGATTTIGQTSLNHVSIASNSIKLKSGSVDLISMVDDVLTVGNDSNNKITVQPGSMQIGSVSNGITFDSDGDATFNGEITISAGLASSISGSSDALSGSFSDEVDSLQAGSSSMQTQVVLTSAGMDLKTPGGATLASYGATATIGEDADDKSRMVLGSSALDLIVDSGGTDTNFASFGAVSRVGDVANEHISMSSAGVTVKDGTTQLAKFSDTTTIGDTSGEHISISSDAFEIKTSSTNTVLSASSAGLEMAGTIKASGGTIGGFTIATDKLSGGTDSDYIGLEPGVGIQLGDSTFNDAPFSVTNAGVLKAKSGEVGGWTIGATTISAGNTTLNNSGTITSDALELVSTNFTASSADQFISLGDEKSIPAGTWSGSEGVWLSGSGEFNLQSGSQFIRNIGSENGMEMNFGHFSVDSAGVLSAVSASFRGNISAESGFFGSDTQGWQIDENQLRTADNAIVFDATPETSSIGITSGSFRGEIVPNFSSADVVLSGGGNSYTGGGSTDRATITTDISNGNTGTYSGDPLVGRYDSSNSDTWTSATNSATANAYGATGADLTNGKNYNTSFSVKIGVEVNTSQHNQTNFDLLGAGASTTGTAKLMHYDGGSTHTQIGSLSLTQTFSPEIGFVDDVTTTFSRTKTKTINHTAINGDGNDRYYLIIESFSCTNNGFIQIYNPTASKTITINSDILNVTVEFSAASHSPSNKITQLAPAGLQTINLGNATLENAANAYFRTDVEGDKTIDILGETHVTGSIFVREREQTSPSVRIGQGPSSDTSNILFETDGNIRVDGYIRAGTGDSNGFRIGNSAEIAYANTRLEISVGGVSGIDALIDTSGNFHAKADVVGYSATISDIQFKENINPIESALFKVQQLRGVEFDWKTDYNDRGHDIGFIAQEVEGVKGLEPFVSEHNNIITDKPAKVVHYDKVVALLVEAVKEQQTQIEELKSEVQELRDGSSE